MPKLANVENCTLYSFQPKAAAQGLPWHVTRFGLDAQERRRRRFQAALSTRLDVT